MRRMILGSLRQRRRRLAGVVTAVVLGVAFLATTLVVADTARAGFARAFADAYSGIDAVVRGDTRIGAEQAQQVGYLPAGLAERLRAVPGVAAAEPALDAFAQVESAQGRPIGGSGPPTLGGAWVTDPRLNPYRLVAGRGPAAPGEVVVDRATAERGGLTVGSRTVVRTPDPVPVTVVGLVTFGTADSFGGTTYVAFTLAEAQRLLAPRPDVATSVLVAAAPGVGQAELAGRLRAAIPPHSEVLTGADLVAESAGDLEGDFLGFLVTALTVFAGIALLVAGFTIHNTFSVLAAQRERETALLRMVGATRRQVVAGSAAEAAAAGLAGSVLGTAAGVGLTAALVAGLEANGTGLGASSLVVRWPSLVVPVLVGTVVAVLSGLRPAVRASRVPPVAALRGVATERPAGPVSRWLLVPLVRLLAAPVARLRGVSGRLARDNAVRNPRRTASTASALLVGVTVVALATVLTAAVKQVWGGSLARTLTADLVAATNGFSGVGMGAGLVEEVARVPGVRVAVGLSPGAVTVLPAGGGSAEGGETQYVTVTDPVHLPAVLDLGVEAGSFAQVTGRSLAVSAEWAADRRVRAGAPVRLRFADGAVEEFTVGAVYRRTDLVGDVVVPHGAWAPHAVQQMRTGLLLDVAGGADVEQVRAGVNRVTAARHAPEIVTAAEHVAAVRAGFDQWLALVYVLLALSVLIALLGIANTLGLAVHERTRELGLLRAVGQTRRQVRSAIRWESVLVAGLGASAGAVLGLVAGEVVAVGVLGEWADPAEHLVTPPVGQLAALVAGACLAGVLASLRPARRAARLDVVEALRAE